MTNTTKVILSTLLSCVVFSVLVLFSIHLLELQFLGPAIIASGAFSMLIACFLFAWIVADDGENNPK